MLASRQGRGCAGGSSCERSGNRPTCRGRGHGLAHRAARLFFPVAAGHRQRRDICSRPAKVSIDQALAEQPQFNPGNNQFNQAANVQATATSSPGAAELNLRGLGVNRNLVLIDGHRGQPADASLAIDVNTIPSSAIDSIEIVTGGAASTYGADAMAGVVNFKLKRHFEGIQLDASYGETQYQDDRNTNLSALIGSNFADNKGNVMLGVTFSDRTAINVQNRTWANAANTDPNTPGGAFPGFPGFNLIPYVPGSFPPAAGSRPYGMFLRRLQ